MGACLCARFIYRDDFAGREVSVVVLVNFSALEQVVFEPDVVGGKSVQFPPFTPKVPIRGCGELLLGQCLLLPLLGFMPGG